MSEIWAFEILKILNFKDPVQTPLRFFLYKTLTYLLMLYKNFNAVDLV